MRCFKAAFPKKDLEFPSRQLAELYRRRSLVENLIQALEAYLGQRTEGQDSAKKLS